jgi:hypothetical protein
VKTVVVLGADSRALETDALLAAGAAAYLQVHSPNQDDTPPAVTSVTFSPDSITAGSEVKVIVKATDAGLGPSSMSARFVGPSSQRLGCGANPTFVQSDTFYLRCSMVIGAYMQAGTWTLELVQVTDLNGNRTTLSTSQLQAAGYPTTLRVNSPNPDTVRPAITAFSFTHATVVANQVDSVNVTLSASDGYSGISVLDLRFSKPATGETRQCTTTSLGAASLTLRCALRFSAAGAGVWQVDYIRASDRAGNIRLLRTADMQAVPYSTELTVTPWNPD